MPGYISVQHVHGEGGHALPTMPAARAGDCAGCHGGALCVYVHGRFSFVKLGGGLFFGNQPAGLGLGRPGLGVRPQAHVIGDPGPMPGDLETGQSGKHRDDQKCLCFQAQQRPSFDTYTLTEAKHFEICSFLLLSIF